MTGASCLQVRMREVDVCMGTACFINKNILSSKRWHELLRLIKLSYIPVIFRLFPCGDYSNLIPFGDCYNLSS